ncbi:MAG: divalent-cation tolerance protein CutA [Omnitrophica bacterium]|nr:divalent-cation tolerance protein CutA [Candidatus Omnitrophota bacterium]
MALMVLVTVPKDKAKNLANILLQQKVCACVNIVGGLESFFWWEGKIDTETESLLIIKTKDAIFSKLEELIKKNHPYSVPEIIGFQIDKINKSYLDWLNKEVCD